MEAHGCSATNWADVEVAEAFDAQYVHNTRFSGHNKLGVFKRDITLPGGLQIHSGIYNATLHNCEVGDDAHLFNPVFGRVLQYIPEGGAPIAITSTPSTTNVNNYYDAVTYMVPKVLNSAGVYVFDGVGA